jgi:hypothetical protein
MIAIYDIDTDVGEFELVELELDATLPAVTVAITMTVSAEPGSNFEDESELGLDSKVEVKRKLDAEVDEGACEGRSECVGGKVQCHDLNVPLPMTQAATRHLTH